VPEAGGHRVESLTELVALLARDGLRRGA
jgi:hypothetical protein